jgi:hypothetical protein
MSPLPVVVLTGQLAAGKSTVARAVLDRFPLGYLVDVDAVREQVTSGLAGPLGWTEETSRQFGLAVEGAAALAAVYQPAGFAVAVEGAVDPVQVDLALEAVGLLGRRVGVVLHPRLEVALERNRTRSTKTFDTSVLDAVMASIDADLSASPPPPGWTVLDTSDEDPATTTERVLALVAAHEDPDL